MDFKRLPIRIKKIAGGYRLDFGDGKASAYIYAHEKRIEVNALDWSEAEAFAKEVARTLKAAWSGADR